MRKILLFGVIFFFIGIGICCADNSSFYGEYDASAVECNEPFTQIMTFGDDESRSAEGFYFCIPLNGSTFSWPFIDSNGDPAIRDITINGETISVKEGNVAQTWEANIVFIFSSDRKSFTVSGDLVEVGEEDCTIEGTGTRIGGNPAPTITAISIAGPASIQENSTGSYTLTAGYSDGSSEIVTTEAAWNVNSPYASIGTNGTLTALSVASDQTATITATYGGLTATHTLTIRDSFAQEPERIMPVAVYQFEEGATPTGSVDLGDGVTVTFEGQIEVGIVDNHLGFFLGQKPVGASAIRAQTAAAGNLSFTFEDPIFGFTVNGADYDGNTRISAYDSSGQVIDTTAVSGSDATTYALTWDQPVAKVVISGTSGWVGTVEELAVILGQVLSNLDSTAFQGVTVTISPSNRQGVSDAGGNYTITGVKPGTYTLTGTGTDIETITVTGITVSAGASITKNLLAALSQGGDPAAGYAVTADLWAKAVLEVSGNPVPLAWKEVGADLTPSGDQVISGYFYADPADFAYGSQFNPELFVKIYISTSGWCNIAFNHVTVDPVTVCSAHQYAGAADQTGSATLQGRLVQHEYTGVAIDTTKQSTGGTSAAAGGSGCTLGANLWSHAVLQVATNPVTPVNLIWKQVGTDTTPSGARVISGYFYADPNDFAYGSPYNPEVFVKVYIDPSGWANLAFNHVTVDQVNIESAHGDAGSAQQSGSVILDSRLLEHSYTGVAGE